MTIRTERQNRDFNESRGTNCIQIFATQRPSNQEVRNKLLVWTQAAQSIASNNVEGLLGAWAIFYERFENFLSFKNFAKQICTAQLLDCNNNKLSQPHRCSIEWCGFRNMFDCCVCTVPKIKLATTRIDSIETRSDGKDNPSRVIKTTTEGDVVRSFWNLTCTKITRSHQKCPWEFHCIWENTPLCFLWCVKPATINILKSYFHRGKKNTLMLWNTPASIKNISEENVMTQLKIVPRESRREEFPKRCLVSSDKFFRCMEYDGTFDKI